MVRFSCFQAHTHSHKPKRRVQLSTEAMHKTLEDTSKNQATNFTYLVAESNLQLKEETHTPASNADHATDSSLTERECRSEEMEIKYNTDSDIADHRNTRIKKSISLGSRLNWKGKSSDVGDSDDQKEDKNYSDGSVNLSGTNNHHELSDHYPEPLLSDSVMVNPDFAKEESLFSIGDPQVLEKGGSDVEGIHSSGAGGSAERSPPRTPHVIAKSLSVPSLNSPDRIATAFLPISRSSDDLHALDSRNKGIMYEVGRQMKEHDSTSNNEKINGENPIDDAYGTYNYVDSAKDWIIPASDQRLEQNMGGETSFHQWDEIPAKDFRLKRIEEWVSDLQHCSPLEEFNELASDDHDSPKSSELLESSTALKIDVNINPGTEAAKRYISSLNASATAAQLTNLGLVVIPFLSAFGSLKALNLSGNAIVRITAGALPRGLHVLNLSKNNISVIEGLRELTRLRVLDLSYNRILRIGHGLAGCSSLKELYLAGNKISEVEGLHRLLKLNVLDLRFNKISTAKCLGQLASNYNCLQALSLEGNPAQKNVGDEQLKKYVQSLLPHITYYNRQSVKVGGTTMKDTSRLGIGAHQTDRGLRVEAKSARKGIVAQKVSSSSTHGRKSQVVSSQKAPSRSRHVRLPPGGVKTANVVPPVADFSSRVNSMKNGFLFHRSRSEGTLAVL